MPTFVFHHKVGDFKTWIAGHQDRVNIFAPVSPGFRTFQDPDDPNSVVIVMEVTDIEKLGAIMNDPVTATFKEKHTVLDPITMFAEVDV